MGVPALPAQRLHPSARRDAPAATSQSAMTAEFKIEVEQTQSKPESEQPVLRALSGQLDLIRNKAQRRKKADKSGDNQVLDAVEAAKELVAVLAGLSKLQAVTLSAKAGTAQFALKGGATDAAADLKATAKFGGVNDLLGQLKKTLSVLAESSVQKTGQKADNSKTKQSLATIKLESIAATTPTIVGPLDVVIAAVDVVKAALMALQQGGEIAAVQNVGVELAAHKLGAPKRQPAGRALAALPLQRLRVADQPLGLDETGGLSQTSHARKITGNTDGSRLKAAMPVLLSALPIITAQPMRTVKAASALHDPRVEKLLALVAHKANAVKPVTSRLNRLSAGSQAVFDPTLLNFVPDSGIAAVPDFERELLVTLKGVNHASPAGVGSPSNNAAHAARFSQVVARQIQSTTLTGKRTVIQLTPVGLGKLEVDLRTDDDGTLQVVLRADNRSVLHALRTDKDAVQQSLSQVIADGRSANLEFQDFSQQSRQRHADEFQIDDPIVGTVTSTIDVQMPVHQQTIGNSRLDILT